MIAVESDALQFLHSKLRAVTQPNDPEEEISIVLQEEEKDKDT